VLGVDGARRVAGELLARCRDALRPLGPPAAPLEGARAFVVERAG